MTSTEAKIGAVAMVLVSTWATAQADNFLITVTPTVAIDNLQIYSERLPNGGIGTSPTNTSLTENFGSVGAGSTRTTVIGTSYGTSTSAQNNGDYANISIVATTAPGGVVVGGKNGNTSFNFNDSFNGLNEATTRAAIVSGSLSGVVPLYRAGGQFKNNVFAYQQQTATQTGTLYGFDAGGAFSRIGSYSVTFTTAPVPEPATWAALGLGALAVVRRRKRR